MAKGDHNDRRLSKIVNEVPNGKLLNILTDKYLKKEMAVESGLFLPAKERWPYVFRDLFLRVPKLTKRPVKV